MPIGVLGAVYLVEYGQRGPLSRAVSFMVDILTSIVAALFIYALWVTIFGLQRVAFAVAHALVLLMIIVTGVMLGLARVMGETAPLLILGPYTKSINFNPFEGNMAALPP